MKKRLLSILMAMCLMVTMIPKVFATEISGLQAQIDAAQPGGTVILDENTTITEPLVINKEIILNGMSHSLNGTMEHGLISIRTNDPVTIENLTINGSNVGIDLNSDAPKVSINHSTINVDSRGIRFLGKDITDNELGITSGAILNLNATTIQNTEKPDGNTYENWSHQADSRGISIWNVKNSTITIENNSKILGFGYPINMAGDVVNGVRDMENSTINITDSDVWGWCAMNIWTIDTTFNITNSHLKGFVETGIDWNSFATIVLNEDIYGNITSDEKANVFNITGGSVSSTCVSNNQDVYHCLFRLDKEFMSEFNFSQDDDMNPVALYCTQPLSAFLDTYEGMTYEDFTTWARTKLSCGVADATYKWRTIAPGVDVNTKSVMALSNFNIDPCFVYHEGGQKNEAQ